MKQIIKKILMLISTFLIVSSCTPFYLAAIDIMINRVVDNKDTVYEKYVEKTVPKDDSLIPESDEYKLSSREVEGIKYYLYRKNVSDNLVLYVHGGAFVRIVIYQDYVKMMQEIKDMSKSNFDIAFLNYKGKRFPSQTYELEVLLNYLKPKYKKVILMGDSSGGNVVLSNTLLRRNLNEEKVDALVLMSPWADPSNRVKSRFTRFKQDLLMGKSMYNKFLLHNPYVEGNDVKNPLLSPVYAEFSSFPKTLIQYGGLEILADDSKIVCEKIKKAGSHCKLEEYENMPHVFQLYTILDKTEPARKSIVEFLDEVFLEK
ncbi:alpha/beta hydrolase [Oceanivirga miroungae]|uniref:Putative esterase/lipase LipF n=1 Tax=Oceanivirga miroungae TaxID=1130046 RepID=A0A6I8M5E8_9FUSO|nr:alpha/beta hydrolase [Oceanivirga miroungae]VWL85148.1 putative esterase/lipase LipF [Oceanivirga miroungae]